MLPDSCSALIPDSFSMVEIFNMASLKARAVPKSGGIQLVADAAQLKFGEDLNPRFVAAKFRGREISRLRHR
jgi:hypothetical protein